MTAADQIALLDGFRAKIDFAIVHSHAPGGHIQLLTTAEVGQMEMDPLTVYLVQPEQIEAIRLKHLQSQPYDTIDDLRSQ